MEIEQIELTKKQLPLHKLPAFSLDRNHSMFLLTRIVHLYMQRQLCTLIPELLHSPFTLSHKRNIYFCIYEQNPNGLVIIFQPGQQAHFVIASRQLNSIKLICHLCMLVEVKHAVQLTRQENVMWTIHFRSSNKIFFIFKIYNIALFMSFPLIGSLLKCTVGYKCVCLCVFKKACVGCVCSAWAVRLLEVCSQHVFKPNSVNQGFIATKLQSWQQRNESTVNTSPSQKQC